MAYIDKNGDIVEVSAPTAPDPVRFITNGVVYDTSAEALRARER